MPIFFVDRNLSDEALITALRGFDFKVIAHYDHYTKATVPNPHAVHDNDIIAECSQQEWVLLTADKRLEHVHFAAVRKSQAAILVVPDNEKNPMRWAEAMVRGRAAVYRCLRNYQAPLVARLNSSGQVYQLKCIRPSDRSPADSAVLIKDGKTDHEFARKFRKKAG